MEVLGVALYCGNGTKLTLNFQELPSRYGSRLGLGTVEICVRFRGRVM